MRIGIDAKWYFTGPVSTRVVLQNLLAELFSLYPENEYVLFLDRRDRHRELPFSGGNIQTCYIWADNNLLSNLLLVSRWVRKLKVDVTVYQTFPSLMHRGSAIVFIHDVLFRRFPQFFSWKERLYFLPMPWLTRNRADRLVATTEFVATELIRYRYTQEQSRIDLVPLAVGERYQPVNLHQPAQLEAVRRKFQLPGQFVLYVGRLNVRKNIENLLKALPLLVDKESKLVIVGKEDWKAPDLRQLVETPGIRERIILTGEMSDEELSATYSLARLFCFPSFAEGFGLPPLEAMASGVPVIVAKTTSLPEVCGEAAVYIDPGRPESIARAIDELLSDADLYARKKRAGLERAGAFTWTATANALMKSITNTVKN
jgi:glycosyltransferase involved in cell wall biosynthesis